jgi:hypothetical protein
VGVTTTRAERRRTGPRVPTRAILICAAFAALQTLIFFAVVPVTTALAVAAPPAYAVVAGIHSLLPFTARLVTGVPGTATITALITGVLTAAFSPIGLLAAVPMLTAGIVFDVALLRRRGHGPIPLWRVMVGAVAAGIALFFVSLPVFSSEHLAPPILAATLAGRILGETAAALVAFALTRALARGGLVRHAPPVERMRPPE